ncbi:hypothetical protein T484DRAFT_1894016 [Baffinella frigidus]|nr:hypothetical protein T484DRAFT_1894016 [Cryptophyta sp. CCMP2293]
MDNLVWSGGGSPQKIGVAPGQEGVCTPNRGPPSEGTWEYADLSSALKTAAEGDAGALSAEALAGMDEARLRALLGGRDLPDMPTRVRLLREVGSVLNDKYGGSAARLVEECGGSAVALVAAVVRDFPGFRDEAHHPSVGKVQFYKRAQIFVGDVYGALKGQGLGRFMDVGELTMFADYRVPQILREVGVLQYSPSLASKIDGFEEIDAGCEEEVEIRALTIQAVEILTAVLRDKHAAPLIPIQVDWFLWEEGERLALAGKLAPHHRTRTSFY